MGESGGWAFAQSDRGAIAGTVIDPAAAMVPGAKIMAKNVETGAVTEAAATATGNYTLTSLAVGAYEVSAEAPGFKRVVQTGVRVQVAQTERVDFTFQIGATNESVTVTAEAQALKTENAEQSMNVTGDKVNNLPLSFGGGAAGFNSVTNSTGYGYAVSRFQDGIKYTLSDLYVARLNPGIELAPNTLAAPRMGGAVPRPERRAALAHQSMEHLAPAAVDKDMSIEAAYVGNRGVWLESRSLAALNAISPARLRARGLDLTNATTRSILSSQICSANPVRKVAALPSRPR